jgi:hypothetical protein
METKEQDIAKEDAGVNPRAAVATTSAASDLPSSGGKEDDLDDMFSHLELNEDELDDVIIGIDDAKEF